tara:strand:- start:55 stop:270 length:216 start_codon:yes stop_codon:yes gene_type:complete
MTKGNAQGVHAVITKVSVTGYWNRGALDRAGSFVITKSVNTTDHVPGNILTREDVGEMIERGVQVTAVTKR